MKYLVIFALISLAAVCPAENELTEEKVDSYEKECQKQAGVSDEEMKDTTEKDHESRNMQCMRACILKKWGLMNEQGKFIKDNNAKKTLAIFLNNTDAEEVAGSVIDSCSDEEEKSDHCETASEYSKCVITQLKNGNISTVLV